MELPPLGLVSLLALGGAFSAAETGRPSRPFSAYDEGVGALLARMTLAEKVGQMTQAEEDKLADESDVESYFLGSLLSGGDSDPRTNALQDWRALYERYQARTARTRLKIPLLYGIDAVHGHNNVLGAVIFPHNIGLGATRDPELVEEIARLTAREVRATGINWAFAPCVAVPRDPRWGRTYEGFSEDPSLVAELGAAAVRGLQGGDLRDPRRVLACAKHFAGDGGTAYGSGRLKRPDGSVAALDRGDTRLSEPELRRLHMQGYVAAIAAGVGSIMPSYSSWNGQKASGSRRLLTEILKGELGFEGFLVSDYDAIDELPGDYRSDIRESINAGMDMVMVPQKYREFHATLQDLVRKGEVPLERIDDAVRRILRVKAAMGLLQADPALTADRALAESFGSADHRALARRAVRESLVLLKNAGGVLPLSKTARRIHVAGARADDLGSQCGGWTISWQGGTGGLTTGTTILDAVRGAVSKRTQVTFSADGSGAAGSDAVVLVLGEAPYAEFHGDRDDLGLSGEDLALVHNVARAGVPVVTVLLSGRPLVLGDALASASAFLAAWLPGSEGQGVADVLFGDHAPGGKLPFTWPRSTAQIPLQAGDADDAPLFPYGFGLSY